MRNILVTSLILAAGCASGPTREEQVARVDRQLSELYQPLAALLEESRLSRLDFLKKEGRSQILPTDRTLSDEELKRWVEKIEKDLMPRNDRMCALIRSKRDLVDGPALPASWQALLEHVDGWREDHDRWRKEGVPYPFHARTSFPASLQRDLKASIAILEERRDALKKS
jgi:hypothetical protein